MPKTTTPLKSGVATANTDKTTLRFVINEEKNAAAAATANEVSESVAIRRFVEKLNQSGSFHADAT